MNCSLGSLDAVLRLNNACRQSRQLQCVGHALEDVGDIDAAIKALNVARMVEPRATEKLEILRRIQRLEAVDVDWPEEGGSA